MSGPDIFSPEFARDPYPHYRVMRDEHPLYFHEGAHAYVLSRYQDVEFALKNPIGEASDGVTWPDKRVSPRQWFDDRLTPELRSSTIDGNSATTHASDPSSRPRRAVARRVLWLRVMRASAFKLAPESSGPPAGFSLIEVVVALALLGMVLLGVAGLFIQASQSIGGARDNFEALGVASSVLEELASWNRHETLGCLGIGEGAGASSVSSLSNPCAARWQPAIESRLPAGRATVSLEPLGGTAAGASPGVRITVRLDWTVKDRPRRLALSRVRV